MSTVLVSPPSIPPITGSDLLQMFHASGIRLFTGVPDSVLGGFCRACEALAPPARHVAAANEGAAVALASGWWFARGEPGLVYMQNSGLGNAINPLISLAHAKVYAVPMVLLVGWRGTPGQRDEPQHRVQGEVTLDIARLAGVETFRLDGPSAAAGAVADALHFALTNRAPAAILVPQGTIAPAPAGEAVPGWTRHEALLALLPLIGSHDPVVAGTGFIGRDARETIAGLGRSPDQVFPCVGAMGHASQIACGAALAAPDRLVWCLDGDGAFLMHLGGAAGIGSLVPPNLVHVVLDNAAHASVGRIATCAPALDLAGVARSLGYRRVHVVESPEDLTALVGLTREDGPTFVHIRIGCGEVSTLGRPPEPLSDVGHAFSRFFSNELPAS